MEFSAIRLSWFRPTEIADLVLHDAQRDRLIVSRRALFSWNLWQILVTHPNCADLGLGQGDVDIEPLPDGTVDLYETLRPVISEHPPVRIVIRIDDGRLRFRDPAFTDPVVADKATILLDLGRDSEPITWDIKLARHRQTDRSAAWPSREATAGRKSRRRVSTI